MYLDGSGLQARELAFDGDRLLICWTRLAGVPGFGPILIGYKHKDRIFFDYNNTRLEDRIAVYRLLHGDGWRYTGEKDGLRALERGFNGR